MHTISTVISAAWPLWAFLGILFSALVVKGEW